jgi:hypothetical protein
LRIRYPPSRSGGSRPSARRRRRRRRARDYAAELRAAGAAPVREVGVVFEGKKVKVAFAGG